MDKYIKMILALPEDFFKDWKWQEGDQFLYYHGHCIKIGTLGDVKLAEGNRPSRITEISYDTSAWFPGLRPLPSQKQLQDMILADMPDKTFNRIFLMSWFNGWIRGHSVEWQANRSFECMWLEAVMYKRFDKRWNGEKWE